MLDILSPTTPDCLKSHILECESFQKALSLLPEGRVDIPGRQSLLARRSLPALGINSQGSSLPTEHDKKSARSEPIFRMTLDSGIATGFSPTSAPLRSAAGVSSASDDTYMEPIAPSSAKWPGTYTLPSQAELAAGCASAPLAARRGQQMQLYNLPAPPRLNPNILPRTSYDQSCHENESWSRRHSRDQTFSTNYTSSTGAPTTPSDEDYVLNLDSDRKRSATADGSYHFSHSALTGHYRQSSEADALIELHSSFSQLLNRGRFTPADLSRVTTPVHAQSRGSAVEEGAGNNTGCASSNAPGFILGTTPGHIGPTIREKVSTILDGLLPSLPSEPLVSILEYGCCRSNSSSLVPAILTSLNTIGRANVEYNIIHTDVPSSDFKPITSQLENNFSSYLNSYWQSLQRPPMQDRIFNTFTARKVGDMVVPKQSAQIGMSLMDLHWGTESTRDGISPDMRLTKFFQVRAKEISTGGILIVAYLQRSEEAANRLLRPSHHSDIRSPELPGFTSPLKAPPRPNHHSPSFSSVMSRGRSGSSPIRPCSTPRPYDVWNSLANTLAPCIQRLVSCGMVKSDVARHLLEIPLHPRSVEETLSVLRTVSDQWSLSHLCGPEDSSSISLEHPNSVIEPAMNLVHPACKGLASGQLSERVYAEHVLSFCRNVYEGHFRWALKEYGNIGRGAIEWILDALWEALREKVEDGALKHLELDVTIVALRRL